MSNHLLESSNNGVASVEGGNKVREHGRGAVHYERALEETSKSM